MKFIAFPVSNIVRQYLFRQILLAPPRREGRQRQHSKEFLQHLSIAYGSLAELEIHIQIAGRLNYIYEDQIDKIINGLRRSVEKRS